MSFAQLAAVNKDMMFFGATNFFGPSFVVTALAIFLLWIDKRMLEILNIVKRFRDSSKEIDDKKEF